MQRLNVSVCGASGFLSSGAEPGVCERVWTGCEPAPVSVMWSEQDEHMEPWTFEVKQGNGKKRSFTLRGGKTSHDEEKAKSRES